MTSDLSDFSGPSSPGTQVAAAPGVGRFMLTLCHLDSPVSIRQPDSPHLKPFTFFVGRAQRAEGGYQLFLHMGYFATLAEAQKWQQLVSKRYPNAVASLAPEEFLRQPKADAPGPLPERRDVLTDTQVMNILEARAAELRRRERGTDERVPAPLVRPEDTVSRRVLKEAVAEGAAVSFAVQLHWSTEPIDVRSVPALPLFKDHLLYVMHTHRNGRSRYFLRLGFFNDPVAARQVAFQVRSRHISAAVVPVTDAEIVHARETRVDVPRMLEEDRRSPRRPLAGSRKAAMPVKPKLAPDGRRIAKPTETLDQTLETLAQRELLADPDSTSDSGVRHLKVVIQHRKSDRS